MTLSIRTPIASTIQILIASLMGTPVSGWLLARSSARTLERPPASVALMMWISVAWFALAMVFAGLSGFPSLDHTTAPIPPWIGNVSTLMHAAAVGAQTFWYSKWLGPAARQHPPLDWILVVRVILVVCFLSLALAMAIIALYPRIAS